MNNIAKEIIDIIRICRSDIYSDIEVSKECNLIEDLGFDSITLMQLIVEIEEKYSIVMDDAIYEQVVVVEELIKLVEKKIEEKEG